MSKTGLIVGSFPRLTETFLYRQAKYLGAEVLCNNFMEENTDLYDLSVLKITKLGIKRKHISYKVFSLYKSLMVRLTGNPVLSWHPAELKDLDSRLQKGDIKGLLVSYGGHGIGVMDKCKKYNIPLIVEFLGTDASRYMNYPNYVTKLKELFNYASYIIVLNDVMTASFVKLGCDPNKIKKINIGVNIDEIPFYPIPQKESFTFIAVGRFTPKKAPLMTLKAFEVCAAVNPTTILNMVGGGPLEAEVNAYVENSPYKDRIHLLGYKTQTELRSLYKESHVFLQHSVKAPNGDCEGWPVSIAEACSYGKPVISTLHGGIIDQVVHGETGYLVEENDYQKMGEYMAEISKDLERCIQMGAASRKHMEEHGDIKKQVNKITNLFQTIFSK